MALSREGWKHRATQLGTRPAHDFKASDGMLTHLDQRAPILLSAGLLIGSATCWFLFSSCFSNDGVANKLARPSPAPCRMPPKPQSMDSCSWNPISAGQPTRLLTQYCSYLSPNSPSKWHFWAHFSMNWPFFRIIFLGGPNMWPKNEVAVISWRHSHFQNCEGIFRYRLHFFGPHAFFGTKKFLRIL